ncbi:helicase-related protein [Vibrio mediterranei]|uniref:helicase-related protein n=1 Tax=Vibrio mediterranei TaxID=689 RepID=UPI0038CEFC94
MQSKIIKMLMGGTNVFACLQTGFGKSLLFQLPALMDDQLTIVISPLIATIDDQTKSLNSCFDDMPARAWHSGIEQEEKQRILQEIDTVRLLYCSPESLVQTDLLELIVRRKKLVRRIVVDEVHLVHFWGANFRPAYTHIRQRTEEVIGPVNWLAITATANRDTIDMIMSSLGTDFKIIASNPVRNNIEYLRFPMTRAKDLSLKDVIKNKREKRCNVYDLDSRTIADNIHQHLRSSEKTIVFCTTKKRAIALQALLDVACPVYCYHGALSYADRTRVVNAYTKDESAVLIATAAFSVGVDIAGIDCIIHAETPLSIDAYLQETGRAGRGGYHGQSARALFLYDETISNKSANSLVRLSYPQRHEIEAVLEYLQLWRVCCHEQGTVEPGDWCYYDITEMAEMLKLSRYSIKRCLELLQRSCIELDIEPYTKYRITGEFDWDAYRKKRDCVSADLVAMKGYMHTDLSAKEYLLNHYILSK